MIKLKVNGKNQQFDGDPEMPLLWVLRDELDLKGTKYGLVRRVYRACKRATDARVFYARVGGGE